MAWAELRVRESPHICFSLFGWIYSFNKSAVFPSSSCIYRALNYASKRYSSESEVMGTSLKMDLAGEIWPEGPSGCGLTICLHEREDGGTWEVEERNVSYSAISQQIFLARSTYSITMETRRRSSKTFTSVSALNPWIKSNPVGFIFTLREFHMNKQSQLFKQHYRKLI